VNCRRNHKDADDLDREIQSDQTIVSISHVLVLIFQQILVLPHQNPQQSFFMASQTLPNDSNKSGRRVDGPRFRYQRSRIRTWFSRGNLFPDDNSQPEVQAPIISFVHDNIINLQQFQFFCVHTSTPSSSSNRIATYAVHTAFRKKIALLPYFCSSVSNDFPSIRWSRGQIQMSQLLSGLIYRLLPAVAHDYGSRGLLDSKLEALDGISDTRDKAFSFSEELLCFAPKSLVVVIDGLERLNAAETAKEIGQLIRIFQQLVGNPARKVRVLLTTSTGEPFYKLPFIQRRELMVFD
jgi:hypothetical protein